MDYIFVFDDINHHSVSFNDIEEHRTINKNVKDGKILNWGGWLFLIKLFGPGTSTSAPLVQTDLLAVCEQIYSHTAETLEHNTDSLEDG